MTHPRTAPAPLAAVAGSLGLCLSAAVLAGAPALAAPTSTPAADQARQQPVVVVMDHSGSMLNADADASGTTRVDAAKAATKDLIQAAPEGAELGLVAFGHRRAEDCTDNETVQPVGPVDKARLAPRVDALAAHGETPVSAALQQAADALEGKEKGTIVLVSDGQPSCDTPPACEVAESLEQQGLDLTVHTIGFRLAGDGRAQETLECIAEATGGTYTASEDAAQLTEQLTTRTKRALQGYEAAGTPITGGSSLAQAPLLLPGPATDTLASHARHEQIGHRLGTDDFADGDVKFYRVPVPEGYSPVLSATLVKSREERQAAGTSVVAVEAAPIGGRPDNACFSNRAYDAADPDVHETLPTAVWSARTAMEQALADPQRRAECLTEDGELVLAVAQETTNPVAQPSTVELLLSYEPIAVPAGSPDETRTQVPEPARTDPVAVVGGGSFDAAAPLTAGQTVSDTVLPGKTRYYRVDAQAGQSLAARMDVRGDAETAESVTAQLHNPLRELMALAHDGDPDAPPHRLFGTVHAREAQSMHASTLLPIDPRRRTQDVQDTDTGGSISVPGGQYVAVTRAYHDDAADEPLAFELTVDVTGQPQEAGPGFLTTAAQFRERFPDEAAAAPTAPSAAQSGPAAAPADGSADGSASPTAEAAPADRSESGGEDGGASPWAWALDALGLLAVAGGVVLTRRTGAERG